MPADFSLPALDRFVTDDGRFQSGRFVCHVALRPWLWWTTIALARNSSKAGHALSRALVSYLDREAPDCEPGGSIVSTVNHNAAAPMFAGAHTYTGSQSHTEGKH